MTDPAVDPNRNYPGFTDAFDWRAGQTWAALIGSALVIGSVLAVILAVVTILILDLPAGEVSESG
jgi:hypothetical protein